MGGYNSGFKGKRKLTTGEVLNLDINKISIKRKQKFTANVSWKSDCNIGIRKYEEDSILLTYVITKEGRKQEYSYNVNIDYTPCNYGSERCWFICPHCGRRCGKLYLRNEVFNCRLCHELNYSLQQEDIRDRAIKSIDLKMYKVQDKLKVQRGIDNIFLTPKPKGMHYNTYNKLTMKLEELFFKRDEVFSNIMFTLTKGQYVL